jgi:hypothetical protein
MSRDVIAMKFPKDFDGDLGNLPHDFEPENICTRAYFETEIKKIFLDINGETLNGDTLSIEFDIGEDEPLQTISLRVKGGDDALKAIKTLEQTKLRDQFPPQLAVETFHEIEQRRGAFIRRRKIQRHFAPPFLRRSRLCPRRSDASACRQSVP